VGSSSDSSEVTVQEYASTWLKTLRRDLRPKTIRSYEQLLRIHIAPKLGQIKIRELGRADVKQLLFEKSDLGLSRNTVRLIRACLSVMCSEALDDGLIKENPVTALRRGFRKGNRIVPTVRALSETELARFLTVTEGFWPDYYPLFLTLARTGCRPGEALALRWSDLNFDDREILIERAVSSGQLGPTKTGRVRHVDMSRELAFVLAQLYRKRHSEPATNRGGVTESVFVSSAGTPVDENKPRKIFAKILKRAALPNHTVYDLRHTFATLHLAKGHPITYVSAQLGHSSPTTTLRWYAHWLPTRGKRYADSLDQQWSGPLSDNPDRDPNAQRSQIDAEKWP
jgi:integrase